jgi:hypothetical protein
MVAARNRVLAVYGSAPLAREGGLPRSAGGPMVCSLFPSGMVPVEFGPHERYESAPAI